VERSAKPCCASSIVRPRNHFLPTQQTRVQRAARPAARHRTARAGDIASADELYVTGLHLDQYRHATRCPTLYWREALRRDPLDARCNNASASGISNAASSPGRNLLPQRHRAAHPPQRQSRRRRALLQPRPVPALPSRPPLDRDREAYDAPSRQGRLLQILEPGLGRRRLPRPRRTRLPPRPLATALEHLDRSLRFNTDNLRARNLKVIVLRKLAYAPRPPACLRCSRGK
jgi:hypothetical protein